MIHRQFMMGKEAKILDWLWSQNMIFQEFSKDQNSLTFHHALKENIQYYKDQKQNVFINS